MLHFALSGQNFALSGYLSQLPNVNNTFCWTQFGIFTTMEVQKNVLPYKWKFSRESNFRYFREWFENAKICLREKLYLKRKFKS